MAAPRSALLWIPFSERLYCRSERQAHEGPQVRHPIHDKEAKATPIAAPLLGEEHAFEVGSI